MSDNIVAKFGGTSVADYDAMVRCANVVKSNPNTRVVVVSASSGVTNYLVRLNETSVDEAERSAILQHIADIEYAILKHLGSPKDIQAALAILLSELAQVATDGELFESPWLKDKLLSYGERMSSLLFSEVLRQSGISAVNADVTQVLKTDANYGAAVPDIDAIAYEVKKTWLPEMAETVFVTQGFIGSDSEGNITTLGRGGSDYSAALLAEAINANELQIWTDVIGIYSTDPRITEHARPIPEISFDEAAEMATFGAKILHPATLIPAMRKNIKVFVGSSKAPLDGGTWIYQNVENKPTYRAIAVRKQQVLVTLKSPNMLHATGFLAKVFTLLANKNLSVDLITTSEISVALTFDNSQMLTDDIINDLSQFAEVNVDTGLSLVAVIGNRSFERENYDNSLLTVLKDFRLRMVCHGASQNNFCVLVDQADDTRVVEELHTQLF